MPVIVTNLKALRGAIRILEIAYNSQVRSRRAYLAKKRRACIIINTRKFAKFYKRGLNRRRSFAKKLTPIH